MRPSSVGGNKRSGSRYVLGDLLGRGGMAEVFAGYAVGDHGFQKPVAIKRLLPELANDEVFVERLIEEAKLLVGMQHGHIVSVLDLAREGDDVFLVMEFVDGPSLRQLIKARGARGLSLGVASYIVQSAAAGLEFAHARPGGAIIHADISPSNLLLTTSGEVRVADFGIARREGLGQGTVEGKWAYMAPEQARGEALTPRSDVFALGVVFYELLTGQHPFGRAVTANERDEQIQVIPPRVVKPSIPPGLDAICMRALAHAPRDRYGRMQQLIDALVEERFTNGFRDGASDLAQAIREVAPKSDVGSPRTMHTDRPVTLMTRSLLRDVTPPGRPSRSSRPSQPPPAVAAVPVEPPSADAFAPAPTMAVVTTEMAAQPEPDDFPPVPSSGAQTVARMVDQVALAQAVQVAQAMLAAQAAPPLLAAPAGPPMLAAPVNPPMLAASGLSPFLPAGLRADGTPMPPFRMSHADVRGEELASVVGGHTVSHGAGLAVERGHRWTIVVLGMAAVIGIVAAVAIQLGPTGRSEAATERVQAARPSEDRSGPPTAAEPARPGARDPRDLLDPRDERDEHDTAPRVPSRPPVQPTIPDPDPQAAAPGSPDPARPSTDPPAADLEAPPATDGQAVDGKTDDGKTGDGKLVDGKDGKDGKLVDGKDGKTAGGKPVGGKAGASSSAATGRRSGGGRDGGGRDGGGRDGGGRDGGGRDGGGRDGGGRDGGGRDGGSKRKGILAVQSTPWSWVTVDVETKETPAKFYLSPGTHIVKLYNEDNGLTKYEKVVIEADKLQKLTEEMDQ